MSELELVIRVAAFAELGLALLPFRNSANIHNNGQHLPGTDLCNLSTRLSCRSMEELPEARSAEADRRLRWRDARFGRQLIFKDGKVYVGEFLVEGFRYVIAVYIVNMFVIGLAVVIHYECLYRITALLPALKFRHLFPLS